MLQRKSGSVYQLVLVRIHWPRVPTFLLVRVARVWEKLFRGRAALGLPLEDPDQLPAPVAPKTKAEKKESKKVQASSVAYHPEIRSYIVLENPHKPGAVGYYEGPSPATWRRVEATLKDGVLAGSKARLRRVADKVEAKKLWEEVFPGKTMPEH